MTQFGATKAAGVGEGDGDGAVDGGAEAAVLGVVAAPVEAGADGVVRVAVLVVDPHAHITMAAMSATPRMGRNIAFA